MVALASSQAWRRTAALTGTTNASGPGPTYVKRWRVRSIITFGGTEEFFSHPRSSGGFSTTTPTMVGG